jgi:hypothetical protein
VELTKLVHKGRIKHVVHKKSYSVSDSVKLGVLARDLKRCREEVDRDRVAIGARGEGGDGNASATRAKIDYSRVVGNEAHRKLDELLGVLTGNERVFVNTVGLMAEIPKAEYVLKGIMLKSLGDRRLKLG